MTSKNRPVPEDLIVEILARLPVESLIRFTCVCKQWSSIILSDSFAEKHILCSYNKNVCVLFAKKDSGLFSLISYQTFKPEKRMLDTPLPYDCCPRFLSSCDGIICLEIKQVDDTKALALWNPALMQFKVILVKDDKSYLLCAPIGFDPVTKDYKVVSFITYQPRCNEKSIGKLKVYSLRKGSWRTVDDHELSRVSKHNKGVFGGSSSSDGNMASWLGLSIIGLDVNWILMSFNASDETFSETPMPDLPQCEKYCQQYVLTHLETMRGCHVFGWPTTCRPPCSINLWNLGEYGNARSWTKLLSLTLTP